jgi:5-methylcytosine-specific restriction endonuclease McrA
MRAKGSGKGLRRFRPREGPRHGRRFTVKDLDALVRAIVVLRDGQRCRRCGNVTGLQASHVYGKGAHPSLRWDPDNVKLLCVRCHLYWWHRDTATAMRWWEGTVAADVAERLRRAAYQGTHGRLDKVLTGIALEQRLRLMQRGG